MMAICPVCDKLTHAAAAPRDPLGRPRVRIAEHEDARSLARNHARCEGSGKKV